MVAGPTELVIIANRYSNPHFIAADLKAQAEHMQEWLYLLPTPEAGEGSGFFSAYQWGYYSH